MTSAIPPNNQHQSLSQDQATASSHTPSAASTFSGAVPAQQPGRSYASAITATQSSPAPAGVSAPAQNAKSASDSPVNGVSSQMAQGVSQPASNTVPNGTPNTVEHGRKPSVVISAAGASGYTPNGGPVRQESRPPISFGSMNSQGSPLPTATAPYQSQTSGLPAPQGNSRVISPSHSPSPIPPSSVSGGRLSLSGVQANQSNGMTFGSMGGDAEQMRQSQMSQGGLGPGYPMHERRQSSQSMQSDVSGMSRNFAPPNGRGRGFPTHQPYNAPSPGQNYRQPSNPPRPMQNMAQFQPSMGPNSPYNRGRSSPAINASQPNMAQQHYMGGNPQMQYGGYSQQMGAPQHQQQGMYPSYDTSSGYYQPYSGNYWGQQPPPSPRPYPSPFNQAPGQPPFHPPPMSRTASTVSERPASAMGQPQTPSMQQVPPNSQMSGAQQGQAPQSQFVKPKKSSAIKITDAQGNAVSFGKSVTQPPAPTQSSTPLIVSTPNAPTPPPRASSNQHARAESKAPTKTAEETKNAFQEQVKRQMEEERRKASEAEVTKPTPETVESEPSEAASESKPAEEAQKDVVEQAETEAEVAAAEDAGDETAAKDVGPVVESLPKEDEAKETREEPEDNDDEMEKMIAEMEAAEKEEEEREKAHKEKRQKEKEAAAAREAEQSAKADEELKRQEREAEEREEAREREREAAASGEGEEQEPSEASRDMFAELKKPTLGPGASANDSGTETPLSEEADQSSPMPPPAQPASSAAAQARPAGAQKPKPGPLKLETVSKRVEPSEPTPGMQALKSARFLELQEEAKYPDGFKSPNPALNPNSGARKARAYDKDFLLQFQSVFKEKPSVDWDQKIKETLGPGDEPGSARAGSARTPSTNMGRSGSNRPGAAPSMQSYTGGPMGSFGGQSGPRTIPPGTTSEQRFAAANGPARPGMGQMPPMGSRVPSQLGMGSGSVGMSRTNSLQAMGNMQNPGSPRMGGNTRGGNRGSRRGDRTMSKKEEAEMAAKMPLTAHMELAPLEKSGQGWKASSIGAPLAPQHDLSGNMPPDMVQRKVKAALNKMTPEKFDKISDQILEIAAQSKTESDGRTLRQVIQLTFEKACDEAHWAGMYARFCSKMLSTMSIEIKDETIKDKAGNAVVGGALFRKYLLNRCQEEFERGWQVNLPEKPEGESQEAALLSDEYYIAAAAKRRGLGLIQFIGQLYKLRMLTLRIMSECVQKLLQFEGDPDEAAVENLTTLLRSVGATMEGDESGPGLLNAYFERIDTKLLQTDKLGSRPRFMIMDLIDLRKAGWKGKDDAKGPKTITQIHEEAEAAAARADAERQRQNQRGGHGGGRPPAGRGDARGFSGSAQPPVDYQKSFIGMDDLRKLQNRNSAPRQTGAGLGSGGSLGPGGSMLSARTGSRRGNLGPGSSGATTRTNTPPVDNREKKEEPSSQNAFNALASLDPSGEAHEDAASHSSAASPPTANRTLESSPQAAEKTEESTSNSTATA